MRKSLNGLKNMSKYDKEYCGKSIRVMYKYIALSVLAMVVSYVSVRYLCAKGGIFYRIMNGVAGIAIGTSCLFIWGAVIEIVKCRNILNEFKGSKRNLPLRHEDTKKKRISNIEQGISNHEGKAK